MAAVGPAPVIYGLPPRSKGDRLRTRALELQARSNHNKAACALANKLACICYA